MTKFLAWVLFLSTTAAFLASLRAQFVIARSEQSFSELAQPPHQFYLATAADTDTP